MMPRAPHASFRFTSSALILQKYQLHTGHAPRLRERVPICDSEFRSYQTPLYLTFLGLTYAPGSWKHRTDQLSNVNSQARANRIARICVRWPSHGRPKLDILVLKHTRDETLKLEASRMRSMCPLARSVGRLCHYIDFERTVHACGFIRSPAISKFRPQIGHPPR